MGVPQVNGYLLGPPIIRLYYIKDQIGVPLCMETTIQPPVSIASSIFCISPLLGSILGSPYFWKPKPETLNGKYHIQGPGYGHWSFDGQEHLDKLAAPRVIYHKVQYGTRARIGFGV